MSIDLGAFLRKTYGMERKAAPGLLLCCRPLGKIAGLLVFSAILLFLARRSAWSAPPFKGVVVPPGQPTCRVDPVAARRHAAALKSALKAAPYFPLPLQPTTAYVLVVRVDFSDKGMSTEGSLPAVHAFMDGIKSFYLENSYGLLTVSAAVTNDAHGTGGNLGAYRMPTIHGASGSGYANGLNSDYSQLAHDAMSAADIDYDLAHASSTLSAAPDGKSFDHIMIFHAGQGAETTSPDATVNLWSVFAPTGVISAPFAADGVQFSGAVFVPETEGNPSDPSNPVDPLGVICHEYGHQLGLPDLYKTVATGTGENPGTSTMGQWSLMDYGLYSGSQPGHEPSHLDAWSKLFLGFIQPETIANVGVQARTLPQAEKDRTAFFRLPISNSSVGGDNEYFLVEYRRSGGFDSGQYDTALPGQGLLVWHIDDTIASDATRLADNDINSGVPHRGVDLVEADGTDASIDLGSPSDPFPGTGGKRLFDAPLSDAYNGQESGFEITNISDAGQTSMTFSIGNPFFNPAFSARPDAVIVTGGLNGYVDPGQGDHTVIAARPTSSGPIDFKIYTLTGNLIWEATASGTAGQQTKVKWKSVNGDGETVASGIYLLHVSGGGLDEKKKIAIVK